MIELSHKPLIRAYRMDCMEFMADKPDGCYPLAIVDPPYGIGVNKNGHTLAGSGDFKGGNFKIAAKTYPGGEWDAKPPNAEYFQILKRITENQIIWGGNYFDLGPCQGVIIWDKDNGESYQADCEIAWNNFDKATRKFKWRWWGVLQQNMLNKEIRIHPTQKPVSLYRWLLTNYAKPGQTILDTHGGSFSSAIACWHEGYDMDICEIDEEYFEAACERFERETRQQKLFPVSAT